MTPHIKPTGIYASQSEINECVESIILKTGWGDTNQIGLKKRNSIIGDDWFDSTGRLYDRKTNTFRAKEEEFSLFNGIPDVLLEQLQLLEKKENFVSGRIRIMKLMPKTGLTVHSDLETRYHYVVKTNDKSYMCFNDIDHSDSDCRAACYHIPQDQQWYFCDTTKTHWVYNGGDSDRIHIVVNVAKKLS